MGLSLHRKPGEAVHIGPATLRIDTSDYGAARATVHAAGGRRELALVAGYVVPLPEAGEGVFVKAYDVGRENLRLWIAAPREVPIRRAEIIAEAIGGGPKARS